MLRTAIILGTLFLAFSLPVSAELVQTGPFIMEWNGNGPGGDSDNGGGDRTQVLINAGFESGALPPWTTNNWSVTNSESHSGTYCATDVGNYWMRQDFTPVDVTLISEVSFWSRQPEVAIQGVELHYGGGDNDFVLLFPGADWTFHNLTANLRPVGMLEGILIWGYSGGGPDEDRTYVDDVLVDADLPTPLAEGGWGFLKGLYR